MVLLRWKHPLQVPAMFFINLPLVLLALVTVMRGPFTVFPVGQAPPDGQGLNPLLQDWWMTIHPPVLFIGFSSLVVPYAIAMAGLLRRDYDGWLKPALPWVGFSTAILATGFIMGGVWAYKVLGWGGYWGWDPVENGSLIPWLSNIALLHGLLVQRVTGSLRRTNFFLAITSYVLVLYASFLTRSGVLADFSVHSFANLGLTGFLLAFLAVVGVTGYGLLLYRVRDIPGPQEPLGSFSRESFMWLGQLVFMLMCALIAIGMSAPLITRLFGPPSNVQTSYYNLVNAPLAVAMGLLLGLSPLLRWRKHEVATLASTALPAVVTAMVITLLGALSGAFQVRLTQPLAGGLRVPDWTVFVWFSMAFALSANVFVMVRGFKASWKHGIAFLGHAGAALLLIGVMASSNYGVSEQVQLPRGEAREALGYRLTFEGMEHARDGKDHAKIAVASSQRNFSANTRFYWSEFNQGYMKTPHIERFVTHDVYISPLEMVGDDPNDNGLWFEPGETKQVGAVKYTFNGFSTEMQGKVRVIANVVVDVGGRTTPLRPVFEMDPATNAVTKVPAYLPSGGQLNIATADPNTGRVALELPNAETAAKSEILAVEVSTKPFIGLVWLGSVVMLVSGFMVAIRRWLDLKRPPVGA
jgi:cytochrome c-type biogenesis protein CcmF